MYAATHLEDEFVLSRNAFILMVVASAFLWVSFNGVPLLPLGLLSSIRYIGKSYETTFFASLRKGQKPLYACLGAAAVAFFLVGASIDLYDHGGAFGFQVSLNMLRFF